MLDEDERATDRRRRNGTSGTDLREPGGAPTISNPGLSVATPGAAPIGVPNFFIEKFRIPPFLLSIYQAAGIEYGVRWEVLAAINEIETDYGRNLNVSSAGALGWMQFMPATWKAYGVDANGDKRKDPYNPVDAIFAAARYLKAAGAEKDLRQAIFAYNHADWYVDSVLMRARLIGGMPSDLVGSLTGLTQGMFPVHATARYADDITENEATKRIATGRNARPGRVRRERRGINFAASRLPVDRRQDGRIVRWATSAWAASSSSATSTATRTRTRTSIVADRHPVPSASRHRVVRRSSSSQEGPEADQPPAPASSARRRRRRRRQAQGAKAPSRLPSCARSGSSPRQAPAAWKPAARTSVQLDEGRRAGRYFKRYFVKDFGLDAKDVELKGSRSGRRSSAARSSAASARRRRASPPHALRDPAGRPRRPAHRPEADPRRLEAASSPRRSTAPRARTRSSAATPRRPRSARSCS
jgi:hypothetical protein